MEKHDFRFKIVYWSVSGFSLYLVFAKILQGLPAFLLLVSADPT